MATIRRQMKNMVKNYSEAEVKVREATRYEKNKTDLDLGFKNKLLHISFFAHLSKATIHGVRRVR